jgi:hypothetical protein
MTTPQKKDRRDMKNLSSSTSGRVKGLVWVVGIAVIFTAIFLAPVISHLG